MDINSSAGDLHRRPADWRTNFSSNELMHPALAPLLVAAFENIAGELLNRYPCFADGAEGLAQRLHTIPQRLLMVPGTDAGIRAIVRNFARDTGGTGTVLLQDPNYYAWEQAVENSSLSLRRVPWRGPGDQAASLMAAARETEGALLALSFPNGPVGGDLTLEELDALAALCAERNHRLVVDACYSVFDRALPPLIGRWQGRTLVLRSFSKSHGLAGCRVGIVSGDPGTIAQLAQERLEHAVSTPAMLMAQHMLDREPLLAALWDDIAASRAQCSGVLREMGLQPFPSGGNFVTFSLGSPERATAVVEKMSKLGFRLKSFGGVAGFEDSLRMSVAEGSMMKPALEALRTAAQ